MNRMHDMVSALTNIEIKSHGAETKSKSCWQEGMLSMKLEMFAYKSAYHFKRYTLYSKRNKKSSDNYGEHLFEI